MKTGRVLLTDAEQRSALAVVRSLGRAGYDVYVCSHVQDPLSGSSRWARGSIPVADPVEQPAQFVDDVERCCRRLNVTTLIPVGEASALAVLRERSRFDGVMIPFPSAQTFERICDKALVTQAAKEIGIAIPEQRKVPDRLSVIDAAAELTYPVVLKPARSVGETNGVRRKVGVSYALDGPSLISQVNQLPEQAFPLLLQHRVVGPGVGIFLLRWGDRLVASFAHRRIREKPPSGGVSVYRESVRLDPELARLSNELLARFRWNGVAMVEYKLDARSGRPYIMEINGRFWGSLQLAIDAGVDFPVLLMQAASGMEVPPVHDYRAGVRSRWWLGDLDQLLLRLTRTADDLGLPPGASSRGRAILDFLRIWRPGDRSEIFRVTDPSPALREAREWLRSIHSSGLTAASIASIHGPAAFADAPADGSGSDARS